MRRLISITEAAALVGVHPHTVRNWVSAGLIPSYRVGPRLIRLAANDLPFPVQTSTSRRSILDEPVEAPNGEGDRAR
jgi:excisionase family DNA binding protein